MGMLQSVNDSREEGTKKNHRLSLNTNIKKIRCGFVFFDKVGGGGDLARYEQGHFGGFNEMVAPQIGGGVAHNTFFSICSCISSCILNCFF